MNHEQYFRKNRINPDPADPLLRKQSVLNLCGVLREFPLQGSIEVVHAERTFTITDNSPSDVERKFVISAVDGERYTLSFGERLEKPQDSPVLLSDDSINTAPLSQYPDQVDAFTSSVEQQLH